MRAALGRFLACSALLHLAFFAVWRTASAPDAPLARHSLSIALSPASPGAQAPAVRTPIGIAPAPLRPARGGGAPQPTSAARAPVAPVAAAPAVPLPAPLPSAAPAPAKAPAARPDAGTARGAAERGGAPAEALLRASLYGALRRHLAYPPLARRNGWQGTVELGVRIADGGRLTDIRIVQSSGYRILDDAALRGLSRVTAVPAALGLIEPSGRELILPVEYRLIDA